MNPFQVRHLVLSPFKHIQRLVMYNNQTSGYPHCPPGLEHVDTAANLKVLSKLRFVRTKVFLCYRS